MTSALSVLDEVESIIKIGVGSKQLMIFDFMNLNTYAGVLFILGKQNNRKCDFSRIRKWP